MILVLTVCNFTSHKMRFGTGLIRSGRRDETYLDLDGIGNPQFGSLVRLRALQRVLFSKAQYSVLEFLFMGPARCLCPRSLHLLGLIRKQWSSEMKIYGAYVQVPESPELSCGEERKLVCSIDDGNGAQESAILANRTQQVTKQSSLCTEKATRECHQKLMVGLRQS